MTDRKPPVTGWEQLPGGALAGEDQDRYDETVSIALTLVGVRVGGVQLTADEAMGLARVIITRLLKQKEGTSS